MTDPDRTRVRRARRGDRRALTELYETHRTRLLGYLAGLLGDRGLAEDVFQEVWVKLIEGLGAYRERRGSFRAWLFRVAGNAAVDRLRREARRAGPELDAPDRRDGTAKVDGIPSPLPGPDRAGEGRLLGERLRGLLAALPDLQRAAVLLRHQQGMSYAEVAAALAVPEGTAKTLVHRGVGALREGLGEWRE